jgi:hypothetical protein
MEPFVCPITMPNVHWSEWIKAAQQYLGASPTRGLDAANIDLKDPGAWLASLDFQERKPNDALRHGHANGIFYHLHLSFLIIMDMESCLQVSTETELHIHRIPAIRRGDFLCIVSGTLKAWFDAILHFCKEEQDILLRLIFNRVVNVFDHTYLKQIFHGCKRKILQDESFILH